MHIVIKCPKCGAEQREIYLPVNNTELKMFRCQQPKCKHEQMFQITTTVSILPVATKFAT